MTAFSGLVLAGGRSRRMGRDKALLVHAGRSLLEHALQTLRDAGASPVLVSGDRPGGIGDRQSGLGPIGGLDTALAQLADGLLVVVPVDMPGLDADVLRRLADAAPLRGSVVFEGHPLPWALRVDATSRHAVSAAVACEGRERSLRAVQARLGTASLAVPEDVAARLANINTPDDWSRLAR